MSHSLTKTRVRLASGAAILALSAGGALAQEGVEHVVVSSTRLQSAGFDAPTPTAVISAADLEAQAKPSVFDSLTQLPQLQGSTGVSYNTGSTSSGLIGLSGLGLRGLSPLRTLVLLDSQRVVGGNFNGVVDVSQMPQLLIQRVDVVTGGASASWGSDAVAGVINFITDKKFEGFKLNAQAGLSTYGDTGNVKFETAAGTSFAGGRGHFEVAAEYSYNDGILARYPVTQQHTAHPEDIGGRTLSRDSGTSSYGSTAAAVPAGQPQNYYGPLQQDTQTAMYGLISTGPYAGTTFDANGRATKLDLAGSCTVSGGVIRGTIGTACFGTPSHPGDQNSTHKFTTGPYDPLTRGGIYSRVSYDLSPNAEIYATLNYSMARTENIPSQGQGSKSGIVIRCDNPYLLQSGLFASPAACASTINGNSLASQTAATAAAASISYGSNNANIPNDELVFLTRTMRRYVVGGDGSFDLFGTSWGWDSYFQHGETDTSIKLQNMPLSASPIAFGLAANPQLSRYNLAQDAVTNASGQIVCRNTVAQAFGCVPFNPFGGGILTPSQVAYFDNQNGPGGTTIGPTAVQTQRQEAFSFSVNGSPIENWAGPVAVAAGYEYREEHYSQRGDPYSAGVTDSTPATVNEPCTDPFVDCGLTTQGSLGAWNAGNYHNGRGTYHVNEVFLEVGIPLLNNSFWGKMDLDIAGRHARYNTAGDANTWKVGLTWDTPIPGIRLRALQSRDIRAPNLSELFSPQQGANGNVNNDFANAACGCTTFNGQSIRQLNEGNLLLKPEKSQTTEMGIVWQPDFIPGFQASIDYYRILVKGAVSSLTVQQVEDQCFAGFATFCSQDAITTANGLTQSTTNTGALSTPGAIVSIHSKAFNAATLLTDGFDLEATYQFDLQDYDVPGTFTLRSMVNHTSKYISDSGIPGTARNVELAGALGGGGGNVTYNATGGNVLTWKLQETQSYQNDTWGINITERWFAGGVFSTKNAIVCAPGTCPVLTTAQLVQTPTYNFNKVSSIMYMDVGANWNVSDKTQLYTRIDNITNIRPPDTGSNTANNTLYDVVGRMYRVGVRFSN